MKNNNGPTREELRAQLMQALKDNNQENFTKTFEQMIQSIGEDVRVEYEQEINGLREELDSRVLAARGARQLTSEEKKYYQALGEAMKAKDAKQALANLDVVMPETVIDSVFEDLRTNHPLLSRIDFMPTNGAIRMLMNTNGYQEAAWGELCDSIVTELTSGFREVDTTLMKLSAFLPVCKAMLDLGPQWLDRYVREILYEALANGLEYGIVDGDGDSKPIGMTRQVGSGVTVTGGKYPKKNAVTVADFSPESIGKLISLLALDENGKTRAVTDVILLVNTQDYFEKVMPATTLMAPDGSFRNDVLPYPMTVIPTAALKTRGEAVIGIAKRYFAAAGSNRNGNIEYSDHAKFLEDKRVYLIKLYANGMPKDNNAFLRLDISGLTPLVWKTVQVDGRTKSNDATLSALSLGGATISPAFAAATVSYTATTTNATNTVTATPANAGASVKITVNNVEINNGSAATWQSGSNTVKAVVTAEDGTTTKTYTVIVTKS